MLSPGIFVRVLSHLQLKPRPDDTNVYTVPIGGTDLVVRMWEGGMDAYSQFCLDFFDTLSG